MNYVHFAVLALFLGCAVRLVMRRGQRDRVQTEKGRLFSLSCQKSSASGDMASGDELKDALHTEEFAEEDNEEPEPEAGSSKGKGKENPVRKLKLLRKLNLAPQNPPPQIATMRNR